MSRPFRIVRNVAIGIAGLLVVCLVVAVIVVHTSWFREMVRQRIITAAQEATGGRVELGSFEFDVSQLRATVTGFVIHGKEPPGSAPLLRVDKVIVDLHWFRIHYLGMQHPEISIMVFPDGTTNMPRPKESGTSNQSPAATVVDLAAGRFELTNGLLVFDQRKQDLNLRGNNLRATLDWNILRQSYQGQVSMEPFYVVSGRNTPVTFKVTLPVVLARDRIDVQNAAITTPQTSLQINASIEDMKNPKTSARVNGHVALADLKNAGLLPLNLATQNVPTVVELEANAAMDGDTIKVTGLRASIGKSNLEASGTLRDPRGNGALEFKSSLALGELGRLAKVSARPNGEVLLNGTARLDAAYNYQVDGNIAAKNVSVVQDRQTIRNINLYSAMHVDPHRFDLKGLRLAAWGGEFSGNASLEDFARYRVDGNLRGFGIQQALRQFGSKQPLPYDGIVAGTVNATGDLKTPGEKSLVATTHLTIAPGRNGIPVTGRLNADYRGSNGQIALQDSFIALPHSKLTLNGSVGKQIDINFTSTNLNDVLAAASMSGAKAPVRLERGQAVFTGTVTGSVTDPRIVGHLAVDRFSVEGRTFDSAAADLNASKLAAAVSNGTLARAAMRTAFSGRVGLHDWSATPNDRLNATVALRNGDLADLMALAGQSPAGYAGTLTVDARIAGTVGDPEGSASIEGANGTIDGEPFDQLQARVNLSDQLVTMPSAFLTSGASRIDASGEFHHPEDSLTTGSVHIHAQSNGFELALIRALERQQPNTAGAVQMNVDVNGVLGSTFVLTGINGNASVRGLHVQGQNYGDLAADARTSGREVAYHLTSDFTGSIRVSGTTQLIGDYPTVADAKLQNVNIAPFLKLAKQDLPARGTLSGTAHLSGTFEHPEGNADLDLASAVVYDEPFDHLRLRATYLANAIDVPQMEIVAGPARVAMTAHYEHPTADLESGTLTLRLNSSALDLGRIRNLQKLRPGIGGRLEMSVDGGATIRATEPRILLTSLNTNIAASGISAQGKNFGDLSLTARTTSADRVTFALKSKLAGSAIDGSGNAQLSGGYPLNAQLEFKNVMWTKLQPLIGPTTGEMPPFEGAVDGHVTVNGPVMNLNQLRGTLNLSRLNVTSIPPAGSRTKPVGIQNDGPIALSLENGTVRLQSVKLTGPRTNIQATGTASADGAT
jgi:translocation and assembly module TamB